MRHPPVGLKGLSAFDDLGAFPKINRLAVRAMPLNQLILVPNVIVRLNPGASKEEALGNFTALLKLSLYGGFETTEWSGHV